MAIEGINALNGLKSPDRVEAERRESKKSGTAESTASDSVDISNGGVSRLAAQLDTVPEVRQDKIEELQKQIANGTYKVPAEQLAEIVLDELV